LNWRKTKARIARRSGTWLPQAEPRSEKGISESVPSRLSIATVRVCTPRDPKRFDPDRIAGLKGIKNGYRLCIPSVDLQYRDNAMP
jgi:hypothetical protein